MSKQTYFWEQKLEAEQQQRMANYAFQRGNGDLGLTSIGVSQAHNRFLSPEAGLVAPAGQYSSSPALNWQPQYDGPEVKSSPVSYYILGALVIAFLMSRAQ